MPNALGPSLGDSYAFVDPWSHKPNHRGPVPTDARFIGAWNVELGIAEIHQALFLVRGPQQDLLWSLKTLDEKLTNENLAARAAGDPFWVKSELTCGCVAGERRRSTESEASSRLLGAVVRASVGHQFPGPPYIAGLLSIGELADIVRAVEDEIRLNTIAAEATLSGAEAPILKLARELNLNPRPAGHNTSAWTADCPRRKHSMMISPSLDEFGCGYCRRKGGPAQLQEFYDYVESL